MLISVDDGSIHSLKSVDFGRLWSFDSSHLYFLRTATIWPIVASTSKSLGKSAPGRSGGLEPQFIVAGPPRDESARPSAVLGLEVRQTGRAQRANAVSEPAERRVASKRHASDAVGGPRGEAPGSMKRAREVSNLRPSA